MDLREQDGETGFACAGEESSVLAVVWLEDESDDHFAPGGAVHPEVWAECVRVPGESRGVQELQRILLSQVETGSASGRSGSELGGVSGRWTAPWVPGCVEDRGDFREGAGARAEDVDPGREVNGPLP